MANTEKQLQDDQVKFVFILEPPFFEYLSIVQLHTIFAYM